MDKIKKSIIIHGPGRSGTTLLSNMLSLHPDLGWISGYVNHFPEWPSLAWLNRLQEFSTIERLSRNRRKWPRPAEAYHFWEHFFPGFTRNQYNEDANALEQKAEACRETIWKILKYQGKHRFITKITGASRKAVLEKMFEDPLIIYIDRDPRAVVMSYYKKMWRYKNKPQMFYSKKSEDLIREYVNIYLNNYEAKKQLEQFNFLQVYYEDLIDAPEAFFDHVASKAGLRMEQGFRNFINTWPIHADTNKKWHGSISEANQELITSLLAKPLKDMGYSYQNEIQ